MLPIRLTEPGIPLSGSELLSHVRSGNTSDKALFESYLEEAVSHIETVCQRAIMFGRWKLTVPIAPLGVDRNMGPLPFTATQFPEFGVQRHSCYGGGFTGISVPGIELHMPPVRKIASVQYRDSENALQTWDSTKYSFTQDWPAILHPVADEAWPSTYSARDALQIEFWAGESDELTFAANEAKQFTSRSGYPWADGDTVVLRHSGNLDAFLGDVSTVPDGLTAGTTYYVVESGNDGTFNLSATSGGTKIGATAPGTSGFTIDRLYAGSIEGIVRTALRKESIESYRNRCDPGVCNCSGQTDPMMQPNHIQTLLWRSVVQN